MFLGKAHAAIRWLSAIRNGLHPVSAFHMRSGRSDDIRFRGRKVLGPDPELVRALALEVWTGEYDAIGFVPSRGETVVDVGANVGVFTLLAASRGAKVRAYEAHPSTFEFLELNTASIGVECVHAAIVGRLEDGADTIPLWIHPERDTRHTLLGREVESGAPLNQSVDVPAIPLSTILTGGCDLLKLDCEGAEFEILAETPPEALARARRIVVELHAALGDPLRLLHHLSEAGFTTSIRWDDAGRLGLAHAVQRRGG